MSQARKSHSLSRAEARRIWLRAQRLDTPAPFGEGAQATAAALVFAEAGVKARAENTAAMIKIFIGPP